MIYQTYIQGKEHFLFACISEYDGQRDVVVLLPGYMQSKDDIDYFMTYVREFLLEREICNVVQVDLFGTGDSQGDTEQVSYKSIAQDIIDIAKWTSEFFKTKPILVTRGLYGAVTIAEGIDDLFGHCLIVNPPFLQEAIRKKCLGIIGAEQNVEFSNWYFQKKEEDQKIIKELIEVLGAELRNICGMKINLDVLKRFLELDNRVLKVGKCTECLVYTDTEYIDVGIETLNKGLFVREPEWQYTVQRRIVDTIEKWLGEK